MKKLRVAVGAEQHISIDEIMYVAMKRIGVDMAIYPMGRVAAIDAAASGRYDGMYAHPAGPENEHPALVRVEPAISRITFLAFVPKGTNKRFTDWQELKGYRVGLLQQRPYMVNHLPDGLRGLVQKHTWVELLQALKNGECDVILTQTVLDKEFVVPDYAESAGIVGSTPIYIYLNAKVATLKQKLANSLQSMRDDGTVEAIVYKHIKKTRNTKIVLHISSYSNEMVWEQKITEGIHSVFSDDLKIAYYSVALNSFRMLDEERRYSVTLNTLRNYFMTNEVDAVIVSDNDALRFVAAHYNMLFTDIPIVFCGINAFDDSLLGGIKHNISGIVETMSAGKNVEQMLRLFPETKKIFLITDYTAAGRAWRRDAERQLAAYAGRVTVNYNDNLPVADLFAQVAALEADTLVLTGPYFIDAEDRYIPQEELHYHLVKAAHRRPFFCFFDGTQGMGALGGHYVDGVHQGRTAAEMVQRLLRGEPLPPIIRDTEKDNRWIFDYTVMEKFGIDAAQLPEGSIILNKPLSLREMYPVLFWVLVCIGVSAALIIVILACGIRMLQKRNVRLHAAELATREAKGRIQKIIESAPILYSMVVDGVVVENNSYQREVIGTRIGDNVCRKYEALGWDMTECNAAMQTILDGRETMRRFPWKVPTRDGEIRRYMITLAAAGYGGEKAFVLWGMDVEELERRKDELTLAYQSLARVIEAAPVPIALCDPMERLIIQGNDAWAKLFGLSDKEQAAGFRLHEGFGVPSIANELKDALRSNEPISSWDCKFKTLQGDLFDAIIYAKKIAYNNGECLVTCVKDLSEERLRARMLQSAADKEREASRLKTQFVMNMSHEIRTPMNAVIGMTHVAKQTDDPAEIRKCLANIEEASAHLMGLIDDVLDLSMIEEGTLQLRPEEISLEKALTSVLTMLGREADRHRVTLTAELDALADDMVLADGSRLEQVFINLVSNGIKFNRSGGSVVVSVETLARRSGRVTYRFAVADTGIGIAAAKLDHLFKPFEQIDAGLTRRHGGAGLGLALSQTIVSMMGGTIEVSSKEGGGTTFAFTITVPLVDKGRRADEEGEGEEAAGIRFAGMRALIVDDIELNRIIAATLFGNLGLKVELAEDGQQALSMVEAAAPGYYDFVLMDMQMPRLDGCAATKAIRGLDRPDAAALPIIAMTANVSRDDIDMCLQAGMNGHIGKPIDLEKAEAEVIEALRRAGRPLPDGAGRAGGRDGDGPAPV